MAWVEKVPSGKWRGGYRDPSGKVRRKSFVGKTAARSWAEEMEEAARRGQWRDPKLGRITVAEWSSQWMAARVVERSTAVNDDYRMARILTEWGDRPVEQLTTIGLQGWVRRLQSEGMAAGTIRKHTQLMSSMLKSAVRERIITENPTTYLQLPTVGAGKEVYLTHDAVEAIASKLAEPYATMMWVLCFTGLRWGELAGLHVGRIDFLRRTLRVKDVLEEAGSTFALKEYPKSDRSRREVPLEDRALELLAGYLAANPAQPCGLVHPARESCSGLVFRNARGGVISRRHVPATLRAGGKKAADDAAKRLGPGATAAQVKAARAQFDLYFRTHDLRHTAASWLVQAGVPLFDAQRFLGHESPQVTQRYAHFAPGQHDRVREALAGLKGSKSGSRITELGRS